MRAGEEREVKVYARNGVEEPGKIIHKKETGKTIYIWYGHPDECDEQVTDCVETAVEQHEQKSYCNQKQCSVEEGGDAYENAGQQDPAFLIPMVGIVAEEQYAGENEICNEDG